MYTDQVDGEDINTTWKDKCDTQRQTSGAGTDEGFVLFPDQDLRSDQDSLGGGHFLGIDQINNGLKLKGNVGYIRVFIMGCVQYKNAGTIQYKTGILYALHTMDKTTGGWYTAIDPYKTILGPDITPVVSHFSSGMTY
jgi:hypothetical protein